MGSENCKPSIIVGEGIDIWAKYLEMDMQKP